MEEIYLLSVEGLCVGGFAATPAAAL